MADQTDLSPQQRDILLHTLGLNYDPPHDRNRYCANIERESETTVAIAGLVAKGLMAAARTINEGRDQYFYATDEGKAAARALLPPPPKRTRSQERYQRYLRLDSMMTFREFLAWDMEQKSSGGVL